jgi:hypothetical protein
MDDEFGAEKYIWRDRRLPSARVLYIAMVFRMKMAFLGETDSIAVCYDRQSSLRSAATIQLLETIHPFPRDPLYPKRNFILSAIPDSKLPI